MLRIGIMPVAHRDEESLFALAQVSAIAFLAHAASN